MNIHRINAECDLFRQIYERLFFYEFQGTPAIIISEQDFDKLLQSEFNTTKEELVWSHIHHDNELIDEELYGTYSDTRFGKKHRKNHNKEMQAYWKESKQTVAFVEFICQPARTRSQDLLCRERNFEKSISALSILLPAEIFHPSQIRT